MWDNIQKYLKEHDGQQGGVGIKNMDLGSNFLLTGLRLNQPANVIRHVSILGNNDVI